MTDTNDDGVRAKIAAARVDTGQGMDTDKLRQLLQARPGNGVIRIPVQVSMAPGSPC